MPFRRLTRNYRGRRKGEVFFTKEESQSVARRTAKAVAAKIRVRKKIAATVSKKRAQRLEPLNTSSAVGSGEGKTMNKQLPANIEDKLSSFKAQVSSDPNWHSQNEFDDMSMFIRDEEEQQFRVVYDKIPKDDAHLQDRQVARQSSNQNKKEIERRIAQIISDECDKRNK